jgi:P-type Ca2+ transporter type 2C
MAALFVVTMLGMLATMRHGRLAERQPTFTVYQEKIFFTIYVFFHVWNQINCRSLVPDVSGFAGLLSNRAFLGIAGATTLGQVLIVTFGGSVFKVEPLGPQACTSSALIFAGLRGARLLPGSSR